MVNTHTYGGGSVFYVHSTREGPATLLQVPQNLLAQQVDQPGHHLHRHKVKISARPTHEDDQMETKMALTCG